MMKTERDVIGEQEKQCENVLYKKRYTRDSTEREEKNYKEVKKTYSQIRAGKGSIWKSCGDGAEKSE